MKRLPPVRVVRAATTIRTVLQSLTRRMVPSEVALLELASGFMATQVVYAVAKLGIADVLAKGARTADEVAAHVGANPDATYRLLRAGAAFGLFRERSDGRIALTPLAHGLRADTPHSLRPVILLIGDPRYQGPWGQLAQTVQTGRPAAQEMLGKPLWEYFDQDPEFAATFNEAMARLAALDWPAVSAAYDFSGYRTIVDIGGGDGQLLALLLSSAPAATGVLLERPALLSDAEDHLRRAGVLSRCRIEAGSFFEAAPRDGDLYVMRRVVHDFDDEAATAILANVRRHMPRGATLLLMESVVPTGNRPHLAKNLDLDMMVFVAGRERTEREFATLLDKAGLRMTRVIPTVSPISLVEADTGR